MKDGIDRDFYCTTGYMRIGGVDRVEECYGARNNACEGCPARHRKYPTPEEFEKEYGGKWKGAVYFISWQHREDEGKCEDETLYFFGEKGWGTATVSEVETVIERLERNNADLLKEFPKEMIHNGWAVVCACTPFGKPDGTWRPE